VSLLESAFTRLVTDLRILRTRWALVGGLAVSARARPRTTEDLDVVIAVQSDREAENVAFAFRGLGYLYLPEHALEQQESERLATVRLDTGWRSASTGALAGYRVWGSRQRRPPSPPCRGPGAR
jgi:hypothetical protein